MPSSTPNTATRLGIRDRAMLHLCFAGGLRVSELVALPLENVSFQRTVSIRVFGKGRRERCLPLWKETAADLRAWVAVRGSPPVPELFVNAEGTAMTRAGFEYILDKHVCSARKSCPSLNGRSVSPHQLRHSCALTMLKATRDIRKVALWLGHADIRTTEIYLRVDPSEKLEAVEAVVPLGLRRGRFCQALRKPAIASKRNQPGQHNYCDSWQAHSSISTIRTFSNCSSQGCARRGSMPLGANSANCAAAGYAEYRYFRRARDSKRADAGGG